MTPLTSYDKYIILTKATVALESQNPGLADSLRDIMDEVYYQLTDEEIADITKEITHILKAPTNRELDNIARAVKL